MTTFLITGSNSLAADVSSFIEAFRNTLNSRLNLKLKARRFKDSFCISLGYSSHSHFASYNRKENSKHDAFKQLSFHQEKIIDHLSRALDIPNTYIDIAYRIAMKSNFDIGKEVIKNFVKTHSDLLQAKLQSLFLDSTPEPEKIIETLRRFKTLTSEQKEAAEWLIWEILEIYDDIECSRMLPTVVAALNYKSGIDKILVALVERNYIETMLTFISTFNSANGDLAIIIDANYEFSYDSIHELPLWAYVLYMGRNSMLKRMSDQGVFDTNLVSNDFLNSHVNAVLHHFIIPFITDEQTRTFIAESTFSEYLPYHLVASRPQLLKAFVNDLQLGVERGNKCAPINVNHIHLFLRFIDEQCELHQVRSFTQESRQVLFVNSLRMTLVTRESRKFQTALYDVIHFEKWLTNGDADATKQLLSMLADNTRALVNYLAISLFVDKSHGKNIIKRIAASHRSLINNELERIMLEDSTNSVEKEIQVHIALMSIERDLRSAKMEPVSLQALLDS